MSSGRQLATACFVHPKARDLQKGSRDKSKKIKGMGEGGKNTHTHTKL